ncbi:MAG TPA: hypothetical protein H9980_04760, partial [Candidatus Erysipelatoclostridium merdavium]|nr:hypothetical protein [Candidatus Erysipelatoclostridium merdavium]
MKLKNHVRGLSVLKKLKIQNCSIEETITKYEESDYHKELLEKKYRTIIEIYDLNETTTKEDIKKKILEYYGNDIPGNIHMIYVLAYCCNTFKDESLTVENKVKKLFENKNISTYHIKKIVNYGLNDAIYLNLLDSKGNILDNSFFQNWSFNSICEKDFINILSEFQDTTLYEDRYLIFNKIQNNEIDFSSNISKMYLKKGNNK